MVRTRTLSKALSAQATTWKGSRQISACGARWPTRVWIHAAPSQDTWVNRCPRGSEFIEEPAQGLAVTALAGPHQPAGGVVDHAGQIAVALAVGDLIDADPQSIEQIVGVAAIGDHSGHDRGHGAPRDAQQHGEHAQCSVGGQPCAGSKAQVCLAPGRAHGTRATTTPCSTHARGRGLQISLGGPDVQSAPPPRRVPTTAPRVIARTPLPTPRAAARLRCPRPHREDQQTSLDLRRMRPVVSVSIITSSITMFWSSSAVANTLDMRNAVTPSLALNLESVQNVSRTRRCAPNRQVNDPLQRHKSRIRDVIDSKGGNGFQ